MKTTSITIRSMAFMVILFFSQINFSNAQGRINVNLFGCTLADAVVDKLTITNVVDDQISFNFRVKNIGGDVLFLDRMYFQAYVSKDAVFDGTDKPAGGSIFGNQAPQLASLDTFSRSWTSNTNADLTEYKYVILQLKVRYGYSMPECNTDNNTTYKYIGCAIADLVVYPIAINNVHGNSVNFTYTIKNTGWDTLFLNRMYYQTYVSKDYVLDGTDQPAGGAILGNNAPALTKDQLYSGTWTSNSFVSLTEYPILIIEFKERYGYSMPECNTTNNKAAQYIGCNLAELVVDGFNINSVNGNSVNFSYTVRNTGWDTLFLNRMYFQTYVSKDNILDGTDKPSGGSIIGWNAPALTKDQTYTASWNANSPVNVSVYKYLFIQFNVYYGYQMPECNTANNTSYQSIPMQVLVFDGLDKLDVLTTFRLNMNQGSNSISVTAEEDQMITYKIYSIDGRFTGEVISQGNTTGSQEINLSGFKPGLYIIHANNGEETISEKFLISE